MKKNLPKKVIGWREWVTLPELGIPRIKVKVDSGARSSALHASDVRVIKKRGAYWVDFCVEPLVDNTNKKINTRAKLVDMRTIKSSSGHKQQRYVIETQIAFMGETWPIEVTLAARELMGFKMLLGRQAIRKRFCVDAGGSYYGGKK